VQLKLPAMVLIDVDGTLVDSVPDLAWCVDEMLSIIGMPTRGESRVREWVGNGVERLVERALTNSLDGKPESDLFERALPIFSELYAENTSKRSQLYPGVTEGLEWLQSQPVSLGCVTNKAARYTIPILKDLGIADAFEIVVSGDTLDVKKPDPGPLLHVSDFFGLEPDDALMIGDSVSDVKAARAAGFTIVCMSYGYNHGDDIRTSNPDAVIDSIAELPSLFR